MAEGFFVLFAVFFLYIVFQTAKDKTGTAISSNEYEDAKKYAPNGYYKNPVMICPHCATKGEITTKSVSMKKGVSGGKATGALLTGGVSLLATGLSRKEKQTEAHCWKCENVWYF